MSLIFVIGDSKYYKTEDEVTGKSLYKQFTYAKNVIQFHFDKRTRKEEKKVQYREEITEGYVFTPNFFIGAYIPDELSYENDNIGDRDWKNEHHKLTHFDNRLFDRDTLWLRHFDVNLLYIMSLYAREETSEQEVFKKSFKEFVEKKFKEMLEAEYRFFWITPQEDINDFIKANFYYLNGRVNKHPEHSNQLLLAIEEDMIDKNIPGEDFTLIQFLESKHARVDDYKL